MTASAPSFQISKHPAHLGLGARVIVQETFTGDHAWYEAYGERTAGDGREGRLVSLHTFTGPWSGWEMHPEGDELVVCVAGEIVLIQEIDGALKRITLGPGEAAINPPGVWHTADVAAQATALFITAGVGTEIRPR
ncbi:MAG: cupin domain-containing protein [Myxococcales bacterium]|nr:cupin domain-containing protein [Myxococcales bacterium]MCB9700337.1 cupin domain-containing protein [Myxococcales bacterium]